jgi:hypothetical protein
LCRCCTRPGSNRLTADDGAPGAAAEPGGTYLLPLLPGVMICYMCGSASVRQREQGTSGSCQRQALLPMGAASAAGAAAGTVQNMLGVATAQTMPAGWNPRPSDG